MIHNSSVIDKKAKVAETTKIGPFCYVGPGVELSENVELVFTDDGIDMLAKISAEVNSSVENIGARRLHTILEKVLEEISFSASEKKMEKINVDDKYVKTQIGDIYKDTDLTKFIL